MAAYLPTQRRTDVRVCVRARLRSVCMCVCMSVIIIEDAGGVGKDRAYRQRRRC